MESGYDRVESYERVVQQDGVRTTLCRNRFEVVAVPGNDIWEQQAVQLFREWIKWRRQQEELRQSGCVPE